MEEIHFIDPPDPKPQIEVKLKFTLESDPLWNKSSLIWAVQDGVVDVSDEDDKLLGSVVAAFFGFLEVHKDGQIWRLDPRDVWYAVDEALQKLKVQNYE